MSVPSCSSSGNGSREAELARLSDLFQLLVSRRPQPHSLSTVPARSTTSMDKPRSTSNIDAADRDQVPRCLSKSAAISHERDAFAGGTVTDTRPRRNTVASFPTVTQTCPTFVPVSISTNLSPQLQSIPQANEDVDTDKDNGSDLEPEAEAALAKFPLAAAKKYPFTFKLMIYKLYNKEDWVKTIKEMLEKSKNEFKPLAEKEKGVVYAGSKAEEEAMPPPNKEPGAVRFKLVPSPGLSGRQRRTSSVGVGPTYATHIRQRSMSTLGTGGATPSLYASSRPTVTHPRSPFPKSPPPASPTSPSFGVTANNSKVHFAEPAVRVLKKRCVGRRRSMSLSAPSPLCTANNENQEQQLHIRGTWVYNAAVSRSASERPAAANPNSLTKYLPDGPPSSPTGDRFPGNAPLRSKNPNLPKINENMLQNKAIGASTPKMTMMPVLPVANRKERLVARRRAMTVGSMAANDDPMTEPRKPAKRPFIS